MVDTSKSIEVDIGSLIKRWVDIGFLDKVDVSLHGQLAYCYEEIGNILVKSGEDKYNSGSVYFICEIVKKLLINHNTLNIDYPTYNRFVRNLIDDVDNFYNETKYLTEDLICCWSSIDPELELIDMYCEINDFNKILNKK